MRNFVAYRFRSPAGWGSIKHAKFDTSRQLLHILQTIEDSGRDIAIHDIAISDQHFHWEDIETIENGVCSLKDPNLVVRSIARHPVLPFNINIFRI